MDRCWMYDAPRSSQLYVDGVQNFLNFAFERTCNNGGMIKCPCTNCLNMLYQNRQSVLDHLICSGFRPEYLKWVYHGEGTTVASTSTTLNEEEILHHEMRDLLNDAFEAENEDGMEVHENDLNNSHEMNNKGSNFDDLVKDAEEKVWKVHETNPENELSPPPKKKASKILRVDILRSFQAKELIS
ncbi:hypothetical protein E3N88_20212 [Mikania micrantha]|uniref:Transposase-associated domain-containing protein n=1 Tax=Mikania micrantha TaxID=192012 RepID=A0A5N6NHJ6_9ASTR|nr:hypothetical protein E3N88_20212 [Mikania micrantha]